MIETRVPETYSYDNAFTEIEDQYYHEVYLSLVQALQSVGIQSTTEQNSSTTNVEQSTEVLREQLVGEGHVLASRLGAHLNIPVMPDQKQIVEAGKNGEISCRIRGTNKVFGNVTKFQEALGFVVRETALEWTDQQWIDNYKWLKDVYKQNNQDMPGLSMVIKRFARLNLAPPFTAINDRWGSIGAFAEFVGHPTIETNRSLSKEGMLRAAIQRSVANKGPVTQQELIDGGSLSKQQAYKHFDGIEGVNLRLGIISGTRSWDKNTHLWWGVTSFMQAHNRKPLLVDLRTARKNNTGPSDDTVRRDFETLDKYRRSLDQAALWLDRQVNNLHYGAHGNTALLDSKVIVAAFKRNPKIFHIETDVEPGELAVFYELKKAGVNSNLLATFMRRGISFENPQPGLRILADELSAYQMLNSRTLKNLEPYIIGLAPPRATMSWSDFIREYRNKK